MDTSKRTKSFPMTVTKLKSVRYLVVYLSHGGSANREAENSNFEYPILTLLLICAT